MKFCEDKNEVITIPKYESTFVYFLIKENEVVYVGQTKQGLIRPLSHKDKDFDEIKIIYCKSENLDMCEDKYIQKYKPIYNKQNNYAIRWGLLRVRNKLREKLGSNKLTIPKLKRLLKGINIYPQIDSYNRNETISFDEYQKIVKCCDDYIKQTRSESNDN